MAALLAVATARPGYLHAIHEPALVKLGAIVHSVPSAISHQSHTQIHSRPIITPVLAPVYHAAPIIHAAPILHAPILSHTYAHALPLHH